MSNNQEPKPTSPKHTWEQSELDPSTALYVREQLETIPYLEDAFKELSDGLDEVGSSRTVFQLPHNIAIDNVADAMFGAAYSTAVTVWEEGVHHLGGSLVMQEGEPVEDFDLGASTLPAGANASLDTKAPVGYVRVEKSETGMNTSVGCLDPVTHTQYSLLV